MKRDSGCGLSVLWLVLSLFGAESLAVCVVINYLPKEYLGLAVIIVAVVIMLAASVLIYVRVQRRMQ